MLSRYSFAVSLALLILSGSSLRAQDEPPLHSVVPAGALRISNDLDAAQVSHSVEVRELRFEESSSPYDEPIETDRHDFTRSSKTVGCGVLQFEYGILYARKNREGEKETTWETPEMEVRYGLNDWLEVQARWNYGWKFLFEETDLQGSEDLRAAAKIQLTEQEGFKPESALELRTSLPTGSEAFTTGRIEGGVDCIYAWDFLDYFQLSGSTGASSNALGEIVYIDPEADQNDHFLVWHQSVALGTKLTCRSTGYLEWFGMWTHNREDEVSLSFINVGLDYLLNNNTVLDVRVGWGLTGDSDNVFAGVGGGFRF